MVAFAHGIRAPRSYTVRLALLGVALLACGRDNAEPVLQPAPVAEVKKQPVVQPPDAGALVVDLSDAAAAEAGDAGPSAQQPPSGPAAKALAAARAKLVAQLLEPKLATLTPEQVIKRYKHVPLVRSEPLPNSVELHAHTPAERLKFGFFSKPGSPARFTNAMLEIAASTPEEAIAVYRQLAVVVEKKLGKPRWVTEDAPFFAQNFKLSDALEVHVGAVAAPQPRPYSAMTIVVSQLPP